MNPGSTLLFLLGGANLGPVTPVSNPVARDYDIFIDIQSRLIDTGVFATVYVAGLPLEANALAADFPIVAISPSTWDETDDAGSELDSFGVGSLVRIARKMEIHVAIFVRAEDRQLRIEQLDRLTNIATDAIDGKSLAGITLAQMTKVRKGQYLYNKRLGEAAAPAESTLLTVEAEYFVEGYGQHDATDKGW